MTDHAVIEKEVLLSCKTCKADLLGPYCSQCGQKHHKDRFSLRTVTKDAISQFFSLDRGLISTVVALVKKPGEVVVQYVAGKTKLFTNPFRYFLLWVTVAQLISLWSGALDDFVEGFVSGGGTDTDANTIVAYLTKYYVLGLAGSFPFLVLGTLAFFFRSGRNLAEHIIFHLFLSAQYAIYLSISLVVLGVLGDVPGSITFILALVAGFVGVIRAARQFFNVGYLKAIVFTPLAIGIGLAAYFFVIALIGMAVVSFS